MSEINIKTRCGRCNGSGIDDNVNPPTSCSTCEGDGWIESEKIDATEMMDILDWIKKKIKKILVKLELPED